MLLNIYIFFLTQASIFQEQDDEAEKSETRKQAPKKKVCDRKSEGQSIKMHSMAFIARQNN